MENSAEQSAGLRNVHTEKKIFWAGRVPPWRMATASTRLFDGHVGHREDCSHHGQYLTVYLFETDIGRFSQWPIILDEALRLIAFNIPAVLCVRFTQSHFLSVFAFAGFLERRKDFTFEIIEQSDDRGKITFLLSCLRKGRPATLGNFDFGMISNGSNVTALENFLRSIISLSGICAVDWNVLLCGPVALRDQIDLSILKEDQARVRFIHEPDAFQDVGWITKKKNLIVENATAENILIAHDRFGLRNDFLERMNDFGADFSLIVPRQIDESGERVGDWVALESHWAWASQRLLSYEDYEHNIYVNGGIVIAKRAVLADEGWSNLLFWNQAEDVEFTRRLSEHGVTPRIAPGVVVETRQPRPGYAYNFRRVTSAGAWDDQPWVQLDVPIELKSAHLGSLFERGLTVWEFDWTLAADGLVLLDQAGEIAFKCVCGDLASVTITVSSESREKLLDLKLNGHRPPLSWQVAHDGDFFCRISLADIFVPLVPQLILWIKGSPGFCLSTVAISRQVLAPPPDYVFPVIIDSITAPSLGLLGEGWSDCEQGYVWSDGSHSTFHLPVVVRDRGKPHLLVLDLNGYGSDGQSSQSIMLTADGSIIGCAAVSIAEVPEKYVFCVPDCLTAGDSLDVQVSIANPVSPFDLGQSGDKRKLGLSLSRVDWRRKPETRWGKFRSLLSRFL